LKLVYFGTSAFAVPPLKALAPHVVRVVTQPDRPSGRGREPHPTPVKVAALSLGLPIESPESARNPEFIQGVRELGADALVVASYGQILSEQLLNAARRGGINLHASILPKYRGAAPIQRAILQGETETGVTLMQMDRGMDTGDIIEIERTAIEPEETAGELESRLAELAAKIAVEWMPRIVEGSYPRMKQDSSQATLAPKLGPEDGLLSFDMSAVDAFRRFRACTPRPGCRVETCRGVLKLLKCKPDMTGGVAGSVLTIQEQEMVVGFTEGSLLLIEVQPAGRRPMSGAEFARGARLSVAQSLRPS
jgi:methionyl-tRNA formyltransferase